MGPCSGIDHEVVLVGYYDDPTVPSGGYWVIKNSWGAGAGDNGYYYIPYGDIEIHNDISAITGAGLLHRSDVPHQPPGRHGTDYTGTAATNTWKGTTNGTWDTTSGTSGNWSNNSTGQAFTWVNQELQAVFDNTGSNRAITVNGTVIAHGLTINSGGTGYSFTGGSLTVTAGGIQANESVTINSPLYIGGPQTWNVAGGKTLTVGGPLHTVISDTTITGGGNVTIAGAIDGGGVTNIYGGAKPGGMIKTSSGSLTLTGASNFGGDITVNSRHAYTSHPPAARTPPYSGAFFGSGPIVINSTGITSIGGGASNFTGAIHPARRRHAAVHSGRRRDRALLAAIISGGTPSVMQNGPGTTILTGRTLTAARQPSPAAHCRPTAAQACRPSSFLSLNGGVLQSNGGSSPSRESWRSAAATLSMDGQRRRLFRRQRSHERQHRQRSASTHLGYYASAAKSSERWCSVPPRPPT